MLWIMITRYSGTFEQVKQLSCRHEVRKSTKCKQGNCAALLKLITRLGLYCAPCFTENERREIQGYRKRWTGFETAVT